MKTVYEIFLFILLVTLVLFIFWLGYTICIWQPIEKEKIHNIVFTEDQLEVRPVPDYIVWARPKPDSKPENWNYFHGDRWCYGYKKSDGTYVLSNSYPYPHGENENNH